MLTAAHRSADPTTAGRLIGHLHEGLLHLSLLTSRWHSEIALPQGKMIRCVRKRAGCLSTAAVGEAVRSRSAPLISRMNSSNPAGPERYLACSLSSDGSAGKPPLDGAGFCDRRLRAEKSSTLHKLLVGSVVRNRECWWWSSAIRNVAMTMKPLRLA
jgi:hypothetical protein